MMEWRPYLIVAAVCLAAWTLVGCLIGLRVYSVLTRMDAAFEEVRADRERIREETERELRELRMEIERLRGRW